MRPFSSDNERDLEDRIAPRRVFEARFRIRIQRGQQNLVIEGWARDISESGLGALVARGLTLGEFVTLEIPLARSSKLIVPAKVARHLGTQYGFQFTAWSAEQREQIRSAVKGQPGIPFPQPK
jgi:PilZ domain